MQWKGILNDKIEIMPEELKKLIDAGTAPRLLDVRGPQEHAICQLADSTLLPLDQLESRLDELDPHAEFIVYCHHGMRSLNAAMFLRSKGFTRVKSLHGGISLWSQRIDPSVPQY